MAPEPYKSDPRAPIKYRGLFFNQRAPLLDSMFANGELVQITHLALELAKPMGGYLDGMVLKLINF